MNTPEVIFDEVEQSVISDEMISAGVAVLEELRQSCSSDYLVVEVYKAMCTACQMDQDQV